MLLWGTCQEGPAAKQGAASPARAGARWVVASERGGQSAPPRVRKERSEPPRARADAPGGRRRAVEKEGQKGGRGYE